MSERVTINDVAKVAGVSKVTVSYILNNRETAVRISDDTKTRVWAAVRELGYHPNGLARALARKQTDAIAIVLQFPAVFSGWSGFINELLHGATDEAVRLGLDLMVHTKFQPSLEGEANALTDGRVDGALLLRDWDDPLSDMLAQRQFPHVLTFTRNARPDAVLVDCDNVAGAELAVNHLVSLGHRRIAHLSGTERSASAYDRRRGYRETMEAHGLEARPSDFVELTHAGADFMPLERLLSSEDRPTAVFAWSDDVAIQAIKVAQGLGLRVPGDMAVVGYDSTMLCDLVHPRLTSVRQPVYDMAVRAVQMLITQIRNAPLSERQHIFAPRLEIRESCGALTQ